ncbi:hypothetical protein J2S75_000653 [Ancylobacter polymorphus]|uniref:SPOR domain-containing protein n=2 Tax=Ancylobacter polymorphus TaxID=223390 RepID=A0ABU0B9D9_9HYPH|nr:SPOR domain-containing protein [Ancylobacter polymorphus]MDQ0301642.1 hypothetical protein [Ancylobacter polymorphus]
MGNENMRDRPENGAEDPLAELARLMAQEDDFAELLRQSPPARTAAPPQPPAVPSGRPMSPPPTRPPLTARRPTDEARPAPGSFAALAAEVYGEGVSRGAPPRPGSDYQAPDAHREPARGERPDPRAPYVPPRPQVTEAGRRMPAPNAAPSSPQRPLPTRPEAPRPEAPRAPSARPMTAADMARQEALRQEALRQEALRQEAPRPDLGRQEAARQEAARQEAARQEAMRREALRQEAVRQDAARQDAARQEAARQQAARQESARREAAAHAAAAPSAGSGDEAADSRIPAWMTRATAAARAVDAPAAPAAPPAGSAAPGRPASAQQPVDLDEDAYDYGRSAGDYPPEADAYDDYAPEEQAPKGLDRKRLMMIGGAVVVFIGAAAIGYGLMSGRSTSTVAGAPPVIRADQGPNKVIPNQPAAAEQGADGQKLIYDRVGGATTGNEQVVSSEEQPVDVSQAAQPQPRVIQTSPSSASQPGSGEPKRVRTLTVRADGTVVEVPAPAAPVPPGASAAPAGNPVALNMGAGGTVPTSPTPLAATPSIVENMPTDAAPAPAPAAATAAAPRAATPAPAAPPARTAAAPAASSSASSVPAGAYVVQIASVRSEAEAQATWRSAQTRYADLLRGQPFSVKRADLGDKGIYYRAQVGNFSSRDGAVSLCEALRAQGTTCMVARN